MLKKITDVLKSEEGGTDLVTQVFLIMGAATIIAVLTILFREHLTAMVTDILTNFRDKSGSNW